LSVAKVFKYFSKISMDLVLWDLKVFPVNFWCKSDDLEEKENINQENKSFVSLKKN